MMALSGKKYKKFDLCPYCADKVISLMNEEEDDTLEPMVERLEDDLN